MKRIIAILCLYVAVSLVTCSNTNAQNRFQYFLPKDTTITTWRKSVIMDTRTGSEYYTYKLKVDSFEAKYPEIDSLFKVTKKQAERMFELDSLFATKMREADSLAMATADNCDVVLKEMSDIAVKEAIEKNKYKRKFYTWRRRTLQVGIGAIAIGALIGTQL